jgi:small-conductance mechanosensitive channel
LGAENVENGLAVMYAYIGLSFGDLLSGLLSQLLKSRKKVVYLYLFFTFITTFVFLYLLKDITANLYYLMCFLLGTGAGYWAMFVTIAAEQFGTNIRSTAANTIPNFVRGSVNIVVLLFGLLLSFHLSDGLAALLVGLLFLALALYSISRLKERSEAGMLPRQAATCGARLKHNWITPIMPISTMRCPVTVTIFTIIPAIW